MGNLLISCWISLQVLTYGTGEAAPSGRIVYDRPIQTEDKIPPLVTREECAIQRFLSKKHSPLAQESRQFIRSGRTYHIDPYLLVAIAGKESGFGHHECGDFNSWGYGPCIDFKSYQEGIEKVAKTIGTKRAYHRFQETGSIWDLAPVYNKPEGYEDWVEGINFFISQLRKEEI